MRRLGTDARADQRHMWVFFGLTCATFGHPPPPPPHLRPVLATSLHSTAPEAYYYWGRDSWFQQCAGKHAFFSFKIRYWGGGLAPLPAPRFRCLCLH